MKKVLWAAIGAADVLRLVGARAMASSEGVLPAPAWELLKGLTWPGTLVTSLFSPVGQVRDLLQRANLSTMEREIVTHLLCGARLSDIARMKGCSIQNLQNGVCRSWLKIAGAWSQEG